MSLSSEHHPPPIGTAHPGQDVEKSCLSCAVRADQTRDGTRGDGYGHFLQGLHTAETDRDLSGLEQAVEAPTPAPAPLGAPEPFVAVPDISGGIGARPDRCRCRGRRRTARALGHPPYGRTAR